MTERRRGRSYSRAWSRIYTRTHELAATTTTRKRGTSKKTATKTHLVLAKKERNEQKTNMTTAILSAPHPLAVGSALCVPYSLTYGGEYVDITRSCGTIVSANLSTSGGGVMLTCNRTRNTIKRKRGKNIKRSLIVKACVCCLCVCGSPFVRSSSVSHGQCDFAGIFRVHRGCSPRRYCSSWRSFP